MSEKPEKPKYKFSYSEKRDIIVCPHRYDLLYLRDLPQDFDLRRLLVPNVTDLALTDWIGASFTGSLEDRAVSRFQAYTANNRIRWRHPMDQRDQELKARDTAKKLQSSMEQYGLIRSDARSQGNVATILTLDDGTRLKLTGRLDVLYSDALWIYDLKTTEDAKWLDSDQLIYYDFVVSRMLGRKIKKCGFLAPLMNPPVLEVPEIGLESWQELIRELNQALVTVTEGTFPDTGDEKTDCFLCFAKNFCRRKWAQGPQNVTQSHRMLKVGL